MKLKKINLKKEHNKITFLNKKLQKYHQQSSKAFLNFD